MFFSASETAFMSASKLHIRYLAEKKLKAAQRVHWILQKKTLFLNAILVGNNVVNIATSALVTALALEFFGKSALTIATFATTVGLLIFGEILPKSTALHFPERLSLKFSLPVALFMLISWPLVFFFSLLTRFIGFIAGTHKAPDGSGVTEEDIKTLIEVGEEEGVLESSERQMLHKVLAYTDLTARDIMTPRTSITALPYHSTLTDIIEVSRLSSFSRFPVFRKDIDDILGIFHIKDILIADSASRDFSLADCLRPAIYAFESQKVSVVWGKLNAAGQNMAVILDEYGGTSGIVTIEDILEEVFGSLRDEFDQAEHLRFETGAATRTFRGEARLSEIGEELGITLFSEYYETLAGYIMEKHGDMPVIGTIVVDQGFTFRVVAMSGNKIEEIEARRE